MTLIQQGMARPASSNDEQIAIRMPKEWTRRADALREHIAQPGVAVTRSDVLRAALARGLDAIEEEVRALLVARERAPRGSGQRARGYVVSRTREIINKGLGDVLKPRHAKAKSRH